VFGSSSDSQSANIANPSTAEELLISQPTLITAESLLKDFSQLDAARTRLIHVAAASDYAQYHLPGALLVTPPELVHGAAPAPGRLPSLSRLESLFGRLGYGPEQHFIIYDDEGGGWAGRFAWTLDVLGHGNWSYLDGGIHAWAEAGGPLESGESQYPEATSTVLAIDTAPIAEVEDVLAAIEDPEQIIWDVRSREEYLGLRSGSARAGHIPGARHLDWLMLKDPERATRLAEDLPALLAEHGVDPARPVITHCQSHHRSGLSYMVGRLLGFANIRAYHGSWGEWGNRDDLPIET
jgi:thiosulfate/3-mercaptopyruvate sulfurtransferase